MAKKDWPELLSPSAATVEINDPGLIEIQSEFSARSQAVRRSQPRWRGTVTIQAAATDSDPEYQKRQQLEYLMAWLSGHPEDWTEIPIGRNGLLGTVRTVSADSFITYNEQANVGPEGGGLERRPRIGDFQRIHDRLYVVGEVRGESNANFPAIRLVPNIDPEVAVGDAVSPGDTVIARITGWEGGGASLTAHWYEDITLHWEEFVPAATLGGNQFPQQLVSIEDQVVTAGGEISVLVGGVFSDPGNGQLTLEVFSSSPGNVRASISGDVVTLRGIRVGQAAITLRATEPGGLSDEISFVVTVQPAAGNIAPVILRNFVQQTMFTGGRKTFLGSDFFRDTESYSEEDPGAGLSYEVESSDASVVSVREFGGIIELLCHGVGECVITVRAREASGLAAQQQFDARGLAEAGLDDVSQAPRLIAAIPDQTIRVNEDRVIPLGTHFGPLPLEFNNSAAALTQTMADKVRVTVSGANLTLRGLATTTTAATVGVQAYQPSTGLTSERDSFDVTVSGTQEPESCPVQLRSMPSITVQTGGSNARRITLSNYFGFTGGQSGTVEYGSVTNSDSTKATASIVEGVLTVTGLFAGETTLTVRTANTGCTERSASFRVTVTGGTVTPPPPPPPPPEIPTRRLVARFSPTQIDGGSHDANTSALFDLSRNLRVFDRVTDSSGTTLTQQPTGWSTSSWSVRNAHAGIVATINSSGMLTVPIPAGQAAATYRFPVSVKVSRTYTDQGARNSQSVDIECSVDVTVRAAARPDPPSPGQDRFKRSGDPPARTVEAESAPFTVDIGEFYDPVGDLTYAVTSNSHPLVAGAEPAPGGVQVTPGRSRNAGTTSIVITPTDDDGRTGPSVTLVVTTTPVPPRWPTPSPNPIVPTQTVQAGSSISFSIVGVFASNVDILGALPWGPSNNYITASLAGTTVTVRGVRPGTAQLAVTGKRSGSTADNRRDSNTGYLFVSVIVTATGGGGGNGNGNGDNGI